MRREKYVYNHKSLQYEKVRLTLKNKLLRGIGFLSAITVSAALIFILLSEVVPSPKELSLNNEISEMKFHYNQLVEDFDLVSDDLENLHEKDTEVHRIIFGMEPIDESVWNGGIGGIERYRTLETYESGEMIKKSLDKVDALKRKLEIQRSSLDTILGRALAREKELTCIPSIKPVREDKLKRQVRHLSGFGWRIHPVHKVKRFHKGIDFTAPQGTPIQATGDGVVVKVSKNKKKGYGYAVTINHGYGYKTLYAHMHEVISKVGDIVKKGQQIGTVGNTGLSTAPHCHYEVHLNGKAVNPIDYVLDGLTPEEYQEMVKMAGVENQSFDYDLDIHP